MSIIRKYFLNIGANFRQFAPCQPCVLCASMSHDGLLCGACDANLPYLDAPHCPVCALPAPGGKVCGHCIKEPPLFSGTTAVFGYSFPLDKLVHAMKYREHLALANAFAGKLALRIDQSDLPDCIIPMPLHPAKLRERGFNQSLLLAATLARKLNIDLPVSACQRVRDTAPQSALPWKERRKNVRNAFLCNMDLTGKRVALVDDVMTTGASLNALAEAVLKRNACGVSAWVVARTLPHSR